MQRSLTIIETLCKASPCGLDIPHAPANACLVWHGDQRLCLGVGLLRRRSSRSLEFELSLRNVHMGPGSIGCQMRIIHGRICIRSATKQTSCARELSLTKGYRRSGTHVLVRMLIEHFLKLVPSNPAFIHQHMIVSGTRSTLDRTVRA